MKTYSDKQKHDQNRLRRSMKVYSGSGLFFDLYDFYIFLMLAFRLVGNGHPDSAGIQQGLQIVLSEIGRTSNPLLGHHLVSCTRRSAKLSSATRRISCSVL